MTVSYHLLGSTLQRVLDSPPSLAPTHSSATDRSAQILAPIPQSLGRAAQPRLVGRICRLTETQAEVVGVNVGPGDLVEIGGHTPIPAEVVAVEEAFATILPYGTLRGRRIGDPVVSMGRAMTVATGHQLLGRVIDGLGQPIDGLGALSPVGAVPIHNSAPPAMSRPPVNEPLSIGIRAIDTLLSCGRGQRVAIMAGSGVGKSSLLSMIARGSDADVTVLCLVGERGRELREFIDNDLGPQGLARSVVVAATSDQPALIRRNAAYLATRVAESFRDQGQHVNLLVDSVTRFSQAQREIGLAAGEIPTARGLPPSSLSLLPGLLERAGTTQSGSITGFFTVLVEGDDLNDPIGDTIRSIVDGHISLNRDLANAGHFPSIDVLASASRVGRAVTSEFEQSLAVQARSVLASYERVRDIIDVGAYVPGADLETDEAVALYPELVSFLRQNITTLVPAGEAWKMLASILDRNPQPTPARSPSFNLAGGESR